jgi:hypothetical protein
MFEGAKRRCGGSIKDEPQLGMTEEIFRHCTKSTRFGNVSEVVSERIDSKELRLFIMPNSSRWRFGQLRATAFGPRAGRKVLTLREVLPIDTDSN